MNVTSELRSDLVDCIDNFIEQCEDYKSKVATIVKAKKRKTGFICIVTVKKLLRNSNEDKTISKSAMRVVTHSDLDVLKTFFKNQFKFVREFYRSLQ